MLRLQKKRKLPSPKKFIVPIVVISLIATSFVWWSKSRAFSDDAMKGIPDYKGVSEKSVLESDNNQKLEPSYLKYVEVKKQKGVNDTEGVKISIPATNYSAKSEAGVSEQTGLGGRSGKAVALTAEKSWVEYGVDIPTDGFYQLAISYYAMEGKRASVLRDVQIDGAYPFFQTKKLEFTRIWKEASPTWKDNQGNEFNPRQEEVFGWQYREFRDPAAKVPEPFRFHLTKGKHIIRINYIREPAAIGELAVFSPVKLPTYDEVLKEYQQKGYKEVKRRFIKIQAEVAARKSDPTLRRVEDREPATEPFNQNAIGLNAFGSFAWRNGGQWAEWEFEVPEPGLYNIGTRFGSWWLDGMPAQRIVMIDGKIPFREMISVNYPYAQKWQFAGFGTAENNPYLYYLEKGKHTLRLEVQVGSLGEVFETVQDVSQKMSLLGREIIMYTGTNPDPNRDWNLEKNIPNLVPRLHMMARQLDDAIHKLYDMGVKKGSSQLSTLGIARDQLLSLAKDTNTIPSRLKAMADTQSSLGLWINDLSQQALIIDYFVVKSPDQSWPKPESSAWLRAWFSLHDFALSFKKDYRGVGNIYKDGQGGKFSKDEKTLDVWVARGRDWAQIIKQLADEDFTPLTGIKVNVNVIPAQAMNLLMLSVTSGKAPDVALGVEGETPIDFAIRNAVVNLNKFPDYKEIATRFRPGALIPYKYKGGDFALPENQNFNMLFYRKDIMDQLGIKKIPDTWEEAMDLIPILQQKGMDFFYPHSGNSASALGEFSPFLFQYQGDYYKGDGKLSNLDAPEAFKAMKLWTGLFTNYGISKEANFYNRFRTGEMPIGVADYGTYLLLSTAAPELNGWWGMKPMPGVKQADGKINRSTGGLAQSGMIFKDSRKQQEGWEFLKWWTDADTQERFGGELESLLGVEARWNTANVEAIKRLPWPSEDINAIMDQWEWYKERQVVLGGYYTSRHIYNIWNQIVLSGKNEREAIEEGVKEINKELRKKREEFGLDQKSPADSGGGGGKP